MLFTGNTAPFHITQPPTDNYVQRVSSTAAMVNLMCSLNITITTTMVVLWTPPTNDILSPPLVNFYTTGNTTTLVIENPQPSDSGVYQCAFNDDGFGGSGWVLRRNIVLNVTGMFVHEVMCKYTTTS